ncbi:L-cysteine desulfidase family protein [Buttiauxella massiliensis]|uniref:L-cysteine desulfidase family protein n=1 Tax=Buttiauxella massiliensis TaxID=2831590 RepID=UPI00125F5DEA|nr:L-serine ammonia-lyase, iron-sulfur-dependent, subunit alpha [Buttiauxella massiliensis]
MANSAINPAWAELILAVKQNVKPAVGCTEPISLALASALAASHLAGPVTRIVARVSPNLMKNGMGVTVPGTGMVGLPIAAAVGALGGDPLAGLEVLKGAPVEAIAAAKLLLARGDVKVSIQQPCDEILYTSVTVFTAKESATVVIAGEHTRVIRIEKDGDVLFDVAEDGQVEGKAQACSMENVSLEQIVEFAQGVPFDEIGFILDAALLNNELSREGLRAQYGLHIGSTLQRQLDRGLMAKDLLSDIMIRTAAASDARMGGACLPAMSNSGSGNQGIAATMPVVVVAEHLGCDSEKLARALILSHLTAIYIHHQLPALSALCAATTAAMGAAAGITWLIDGSYKSISMAISNMIGDVSGMICDGASNSCAMKVSTSAASAWKAVLMALDNTSVSGNEGIVAHDVEQSIRNLCALASQAMQHTDRQIIAIMASKVA